MKNRLYIIVVFFVSMICLGHSETITKSDILATVKHIRLIAQEQKNELDKANYDYQQQANQLKEQTLIAIKYQKQASENARERDVILYFFAAIFSVYIGTLFAAPLSKLAEPYGMIAVIACYLGSAIAGYTLGRLVLANLARFIP